MGKELPELSGGEGSPHSEAALRRVRVAEAEALRRAKGRTPYGDDHWKWHVSGGPVLGANETREFIIRSLGATRKGGVEAGTTQEWHLLQGATRRVELRRVIELALMTFL